jgi:hypothetical protein
MISFRSEVFQILLFRPWSILIQASRERQHPGNRLVRTRYDVRNSQLMLAARLG